MASTCQTDAQATSFAPRNLPHPNKKAARRSRTKRLRGTTLIMRPAAKPAHRSTAR